MLALPKLDWGKQLNILNICSVWDAGHFLYPLTFVSALASYGVLALLSDLMGLLLLMPMLVLRRLLRGGESGSKLVPEAPASTGS